MWRTSVLIPSHDTLVRHWNRGIYDIGTDNGRRFGDEWFDIGTRSNQTDSDSNDSEEVELTSRFAWFARFARFWDGHSWVRTGDLTGGFSFTNLRESVSPFVPP